MLDGTAPEKSSATQWVLPVKRFLITFTLVTSSQVWPATVNTAQEKAIGASETRNHLPRKSWELAPKNAGCSEWQYNWGERGREAFHFGVLVIATRRKTTCLPTCFFPKFLLSSPEPVTPGSALVKGHSTTVHLCFPQNGALPPISGFYIETEARGQFSPWSKVRHAITQCSRILKFMSGQSRAAACPWHAMCIQLNFFFRILRN